MDNRFISYSSADEFIIQDKESDRFLDKNEIVAYLNEQNEQIADLEAKLAEEKNRNKKLNHEAQKYYEDAYCNGFQNQTAIKELEKVKEYISKGLEFDIDVQIWFEDYIDQQIKSLKGEVDE